MYVSDLGQSSQSWRTTAQLFAESSRQTHLHPRTVRSSRYSLNSIVRPTEMSGAVKGKSRAPGGRQRSEAIHVAIRNPVENEHLTVRQVRRQTTHQADECFVSLRVKVPHLRLKCSLMCLEKQ